MKYKQRVARDEEIERERASKGERKKFIIIMYPSSANETGQKQTENRTKAASPRPNVSYIIYNVWLIYRRYYNKIGLPLIAH